MAHADLDFIFLFDYLKVASVLRVTYLFSYLAFIYVRFILHAILLTST